MNKTIMARKLFSGLLVLCLLAGFLPQLTQEAAAVDVWNGSSASVPLLGDGSEISPYQIRTGAELAWLQERFAAGELREVHVELAADIDLGNHPWTPISTGDYGVLSVFDGKGFSVSGLNVNNPGEDMQGLFGSLVAATVKNLSVSGTVKGREQVGGIAGRAVNCYLDQLSFSGSVEGEDDVGGIVGRALTLGLASTEYNLPTLLTNSHNSATVTATAADAYVGGVVGYMLRTHAGVVVANCYNSGPVSASGAEAKVGGVVGYSDGRIVSCYNLGQLSSGGLVGGVIGYGFGDHSGNYWRTGLGASVGMAQKGNDVVTLESFGSFSGAGSAITLTDGSSNTQGFSQSSLLEALNDGALFYNEMDVDFNPGSELAPPYPAFSWEIRSGENEGFPVFSPDEVATQHWSDLAQAPLEGLGTRLSPYEITKGEELGWVQLQVQNGLFDGKYARITKDIDLSGHPFDPIGSVGNPFSGNFDGGGFVVSAADIYGSSGAVGFFGSIAQAAVVQNLNIEGSVQAQFESGLSGSVGGIAGSSSGLILNSGFRYGGEVEAGGGRLLAVGGLVGHNSGQIVNCYNKGSVIARQAEETLVGGLVGLNDGSVFNALNNGNQNLNMDLSGVTIGALIGRSGTGGTLRYAYWRETASAYGAVGDDRGDSLDTMTQNAIAQTGISVDGRRYYTDVSALEAAATLYNEESPEKGLLATAWHQEDLAQGLVPLPPTSVGFWEDTIQTEALEGSGTAAEPWLIDTPEKLANVMILTNSEEWREGEKHFRLMDDIDLSGAYWTPIGTENATSGERIYFSAVFDGNGYSITGMSTIIEESGKQAGLFGNIREATIKNLHVEGFVGEDLQAISAGGRTPAEIGGLVGNAVNSKLVNCSFSGNIESYGDGNNVGGLVGSMTSESAGSLMLNCHSDAQIYAEGGRNEATKGVFVAGLCALPLANSGYALTIANSAYTGSITSAAQDANIGGVVAYQNSGVVTNCYSTGDIEVLAGGSGTSGALVGSATKTVENSYYLSSGLNPGIGFIAINLNPTISNIGSFAQADGPVTMSDGSSASARIPDESMLAALNIGAGFVNREAQKTSAYKALLWRMGADGLPQLSTVVAFADVSGDGHVSSRDLKQMAAAEHYNGDATEQSSAMDLNEDGRIDFLDIAAARKSDNFGN